MAKRLARLLCVSSLLLLQAGCVQAKSPRLLSQAQLEDPVLVANWLKQNAAAADRAGAAAAYAEGVNEARRNAWGPAVKSYGLSALLLPTPQALNAYAGAVLHSTGALRKHRKDWLVHQDRDLKRFENLSRAALASDAVEPTLNAQERQQTAAAVACVAAYRRTKARMPDCAPLTIYGVEAK